jgi:hypothetical protein
VAQPDSPEQDDLNDGGDNVLSISPAAFVLNQRRRAAVGAINDLEASPDDAAKAAQLARATGAGPATVYGNLENFEQQHKAALTSNILDNNPYIRDYIQTHPLGSKISNDDWGQLDKLSQTLQQATGVTTLKDAAKDFAEGMALDKPIGLFGMDEPKLEDVYAHPGWAAVLGAASVVGALPDLGMRLPGGVINAGTQYLRRKYEAITGKSGEDEANQFLQAISDPGAMATLGPLAAEGAEVLGAGLRMREELRKAAPYIKAGEVPPPGVSQIIDDARQDENKEFLKSLKEQEQAANATNTIERDPESFKAFVNQHNPGHIELQADAVRSLLGEEAATPGDGKFGDIPGFNEELALAERHNGHVQVPLADWLLFANKNPEEAKFLQEYATLPGGVTKAEGELAKEREQGLAAEEVEEPKPEDEVLYHGTSKDRPFTKLKDARNGTWFTTDPAEASQYAIENDSMGYRWEDGKPVATNRMPRVMPMRHTFENTLELNELPKELKEATNYKKAQGVYFDQLRQQGYDSVRFKQDNGHSIVVSLDNSKLKPLYSDPHTLAMSSIRSAAGLEPIFAPKAEAKSLIPETAEDSILTTDSGDHTVKSFPAREAMALVDKEQLTGVPRALAEFFHNRLDKLAGDTKVWVASPNLMRELNKTVKVRPNAPGFYYPDAHAIVMREDAARGALGHDVATHILIHEVGHAATYAEMREFPAIKEMVGNLMSETDKWLREQAPEDRKTHDYAFKNADEFVAETFSNPKFQEVLATTPLSNELAGRLGLNAKSSSVWDAVKQVVANLIERLTGARLPPTILDGMMRIGEAFEEANKVTREGRGGEALPAQEREPELPGVTRMESRSAFRTPGATGLSADAMRRYLGLIEKQHEAEQAHIASKAEEDERRHQTAEWKENEKRVRSEVREGINRRPDIAADRYLRDGILDGRKARETFKLDKGSLTDEQLRSLSPDYYSSAGANPDDMGRLFGYQSGDALIQALGQLTQQREMEGLTPQAHISKLVSVATEHEMQRQYGDLEENILREAKEHVFSQSQIDILADETVHLASLAGSELPISKDDLLKGARQVFDASPLRAISSKAFEASAGRAGQAVQDALLKGDYRAALKAKQEQTNAAIYANLALKHEKVLKRFQETDAPRWGRREPPGVPQEDAVWMHQILLQVMGPDGIQTSRQDLERRKEMSSPYTSLRDYVEAKNKANGTASTDPDNPPVTHTLNVIPDLFSTNWPGKDLEGLSVAEFNGVYDSLKSINHYGHEANKYEVKGNKEDLAKVVSGLVERLKAAVDNKPAVSGAHEESKFRTIGSLLLNTETWLNRLDLGNRQGPFNQLIMRPITEGQNYLRQLNRDFAAKWKDLGPFPDFNKSVTNTIFRTDDGRFLEMTKGHAYAVLQNMGNPLQRRKLIDGWNISKDQDTGEQMVWNWLKNVAGMGPEDLARAQKMGKVFSDAFTLAEHAYVHTAGVAPARIELYKVRTPWGDADEWYHPLIADPLRHSSKMTVDDMMGDSGFWKPSPASGYTKTRTGARYPLDLSFESAAFKLKQILNDAAMRIPITEVSKIVYNKSFMNAFKEYYGPEYHSALDAWMKDAAGNRQWQPVNMRALDRWVNSLAQNMSTMMIGFNPGTVAKHGLTAGIFSSWEVGFGNWASSMLHMIHELPGSRERWKFAMDNSEEIRNRLHNVQDTIVAQNKELFKAQKNRVFDATRVKLENFRDTVNWWGHAPVGAGDLLSAVSMWDAEYRRLNKEDPDMSHGDLVYAADTAVRRTHGSSILTNRSAVQRAQSPFVRLLMPFYTFLSNALQRNYELAWKAKLATQGRELPEMPGFLEEKFEAGPQHILPIMGGVAVFGLAVGLIEHLVSGQPKKQDESEGAHITKILLRGYPAQVPLVRDVSNYLIDGHDPSIGLYGTLAQDVKKSLTTKSYDYRTNPGKTFRTAADVLSITTGLTTQSTDKLGEYLINVLAGHEHPKGFGDLWTGMRTGTQQAPRR